MNKSPFVPEYLRNMRINTSEKWMFFASGISSYIASLFAEGFVDEGRPLLVSFFFGCGVFLVLFILSICIVYLKNNSFFYRYPKLSEYEICSFINEKLPDELMRINNNMVNTTDDINKQVIYQHILYQLDVIIEFIDTHVRESLIRGKNNNGHMTGRAYNRITPDHLEAVLCCIYRILVQVILEIPDNMYAEALKRQVNCLACKHLKCDSIEKSKYMPL